MKSIKNRLLTTIFLLCSIFSVFIGSALYFQYLDWKKGFEGAYTENVYAAEYHMRLQSEKKQSGKENILTEVEEDWREYLLDDRGISVYLPKQYVIAKTFGQKIYIGPLDGANDYMPYMFFTMEKMSTNDWLELLKQEKRDTKIEQINGYLRVSIHMDNEIQYITLLEQKDYLFVIEHLGVYNWDFTDDILKTLKMK
ncbi:MAG: hypothetical protein V1848_01660 [Candidatus Magasanikbacteria bacterium]